MNDTRVAPSCFAPPNGSSRDKGTGVFVTDGDQRSTLALVRSLGGVGIPVTVGEMRRRSMSGQSRYCAKTVCYPSPLSDPEGFRAFVRQEILRGGYSVLTPMTDITVQLVASMLEELKPRVRIPIPGINQVMRAQDKEYTLSLARELGIACPETHIVSGMANIDCVAREVCYPAVIKPKFSYFLRRGRWISGNVQYARCPAELIAKYRLINDQIPGPLIQEKLEGEGRGVFLLIWNRQLKAAFCHRRLREQPPSGGVGVYCESIPMDEQLLQNSFELVQALEWEGPIMVEYKVDNRDKIPKLMEVNGRFWGSLQLAIDSGINFPLLLYRLMMGDQISAGCEYRTGVKYRWLLGDSQHLINVLRMPSLSQKASSYSAVSKWRALFNFLKLYERDLHYADCRLDDLLPFLFQCRAFARKGLQRVSPWQVNCVESRQAMRS